ncbi:MAG: tRNA threonylcarbamoyladenosine dehydratase [Desulfobulbaceae bacterium]|uniref:tRNA threonylcarbamoyladenosine dehydratase n=1 Tax=Candidatus Desulfatifera sulfidica TaxID=2841691 RepID=A0A8J6N5T4_9BACT|nr:tRNA threonylcarbamoyladenosine dehydratase [Candidatus Desulfatifera sulfidica]
MARFSRIRSFLGDKGFARLSQASVTIVGLGAVGGYCCEALARSGIGALRLVDFDVIQPSNINRQIHALESTLGQPKVQAATERIQAINPDCRVESLQIFAEATSLETILSPTPTILVDAIDSLNPKVQLLTAAHEREIPTISSMGAALRSDPAQIKVGDLMDTKNCPLARRMRQRLRKNGITRGIRCVYSTEEVDFTYQGPVQPAPDSPCHDKGRPRNTLGSLPTLTGIFGLMIANEVILQIAENQST